MVFMVYPSSSVFLQTPTSCPFFIPVHQTTTSVPGTTYFTITKPTAMTSGNTFQFPICGIVDSILVAKVDSSFEELDNYYWHAKFENIEGYITIIHQNNRTDGYFAIEETRYDIEALTSEVSIVTKLTRNSFCNLDDLSEEDEEQKEDNIVLNRKPTRERSSSLAPCTTAPIRVLVLYTQRAKSTAGSVNNVKSRVNKMFAFGKEAFENSAVGGISFELADVIEAPVKFTDWEEVGGVIPPLHGAKEFASKVNFLPNQYQDIREQYKADLCVLLYDIDIEFSFTGAVSRLPNVFPDFDRNFMALNISNNSRDETFIHELGHLLDCHHEPSAGGNGGSLGTAFPHVMVFKNWFTTKVRHTIMFSCISCIFQNDKGKQFTSSRINHFSNPSVSFKTNFVTQETGVVNERDCAKTLRAKKCIMSDFYDWTELDAIIVGPNTVCANKPINVHISPITNNPSKPVTIRWFREWINTLTNVIVVSEVLIPNPSPDPFNYTYLPQIQNIGKTLGLRMELTYEGVTKNFRWGISIVNPCPTPSSKIKANSSSTIDVKIVPNPTLNNTIRFNFTNEIKSDINVKLFDIGGKLVLKKMFYQLEAENQNIELNCSSCSSGLYNLVISSDSDVKQQKIIIQN